MSLCYRCEVRAMFLETCEYKDGKMVRHGFQPRMECGDITSSKWACYMYKPSRPIRVRPMDKDDPRPMFAGSLLSCRVGVSTKKAELLLDHCCFKDGGAMVYWAPARDVLTKAIKNLTKRIKQSKSLRNIKRMQIERKELRAEKGALKS